MVELTIELTIELIIVSAVGIAFIVLGALHIKGFLMPSRYTRKISKQDKAPFGKISGLGAVILGASTLAFGVLSGISLLTQNQAFLSVGAVIWILGVIGGVVLMLCALKYIKEY